MTTLENPPYSLDLAPADFYLFRRLKSGLKGRRLCNVADINTNATEELKKLSQNGFRNVSTPLQSLAEGCSLTRGLF